MSEEEKMEQARAIVATWPPLTEADCRDLTSIAATHHARLRKQATEPLVLPAAA